MRFTPVALLLAAAPAAAAPSTIAHQGRLLDASGAAISGTHALTFSLYDADSGGALKWSETHPAVQVTDGFYAVILGQLDPLDFDAVSGARWLEVSGASVGTLARSPLGAVPWALQAAGVALVPEAAGTGARACATGEIGRLRFNTDTNGLELCRAAESGGGTWSGLVVANQIVGNDAAGRQYADGTFARSCREYRDSPQYTAANGDGVYWIQPTGWAPVKAYCDMTTDNGGWTRVYREFHTGQEDGPSNAEMNSTWGDVINSDGGLNPVDIYDRIGAVDVLYDLQTHWLKTPQVSKANFAWLWPDSATAEARNISAGAVLSSGQSWPTVYHHIWANGQMEISTNTTWDSAVILDSGTDTNHGWAIWTAANGVYKRNGGYQTPADLWVEIYLR